MNFKRSFKLFIFFLVIVSLFTLTGCKKDDDKGNDDGGNENNQQVAFDDLSVGDYVGKNGVVAAANPYAA